MFDKLVESTNQKQTGRNKFYLVTSLIYGSSLSVLAVGTILWFNPGLAEANTLTILLPPVPVAAPPPEAAPAIKVQPDPGFVEPKAVPDKIIDPAKVTPKPPAPNNHVLVHGVPVGLYSSPTTGIPSGLNSDPSEAPPPPAPTPTPKPVPTPEPTPVVQKMITVSTGVLQGKAIRKIQPPYPQIARQVKAAGTVPIQITISEEGRVIEASPVGGHPMLRDAARQAALQWVFSPTVLSGKPVQVSGVISFNFILN